MPDAHDHASSPDEPSSGHRRQRAPTITINTTSNDQSEALDDPAPLLSDAAAEQSHGPSFDSARPTSAHNISSPTSKWTDIKPHNFLAVPSTRSRANSVDSDEPGHSPTTVGGATSITSLASTADDRSTTEHSNDNIINDEEALKPDPGKEAEFQVENNKFAFSPGQLSKLLNPKSLAAFHALGGLKGLERGLRTDRHTGLSVDETELQGNVSHEDAIAAAAATVSEQKVEKTGTLSLGPRRSSTLTAGTRKLEDGFADRRRVFNDNRLPEKKAKSIFKLAWLAYNDKVLILLSVAAVISLALGIYQSVRPTNGEAPVEWVEGVAIIVAIVIVVVVGAANDWQKERQFVKLNKKKDDRTVKVIRSGRSREISVHDILVGDVMHLEPGDMVPVDGIFIEGYNVKCDESSATGESDLLRKHAGDEVYAAVEAHHNVAKMDPFIISGSKVSEGVGHFLVTATGVNSTHGKTMMSLREDAQTTPLQTKLNRLAEYIAKLGLAAGLVLFVATFIKFLVSIAGSQKHANPDEKGQMFLQVFLVSVTIIVVAVPEGLPLAVTLALAFATTRMLKDNNLVRLLRACETMGNATTVCSDKTGTLTQNRMTTVAGVLGTSSRFGELKYPEESAATSPDSPSKSKNLSPDSPIHRKGSDALESPAKRKESAGDIWTCDQTTPAFVDSLDPEVKSLLKMSIVANSTAFEGEDDNGNSVFIGSKTETALLDFAHNYLDLQSVAQERECLDIVQMFPFDSGRKCMGVVVKLKSKKYRLLVKGASEIMLGGCSRIITNPSTGTSDVPLSMQDLENMELVIDAYASRSLRTIGLVYKDFERWPPKGTSGQDDDSKLAVFEKVFKEMTFLGIVGIQDPLREGVADAVRACQNAGVFVRMVTGDNILTAKAIAQECGIYDPGEGHVMEGPVFRRLSRNEMDKVIPKLQVLARSSPEDKRILVSRLKALGETVAVTGDGTNDAPALKTADVGFSMGIAGTEVAKEASAIILMDDNFASIVKAIMWGRAVNDSVKKFLQFQITVNITAVVLTFVSAVASDSETSVLTPVQLLWVNLIMDTFAALALATDPPTPSILNRNPEPKSAPLITVTMWKMIVGQSIFQLAVTLVLYFCGENWLSYQSDREHEQFPTLVFNVFVWMQVFNQYNNRRLDNKFNILEGVHRNYFFIGIQAIIVGFQIMIVFVGGRAFSVHRLNRAQWIYSIVLGFLSIPVAMLIRLIPDPFISKLIPNWFVRSAAPRVLVSDEERQFEWNPELEAIRDELTFLKRVRGGRLTVLKYRLQHPNTLIPRSRSNSTASISRSRTNSQPATPTNELTEWGAMHANAPPTPDSRRSLRRLGRSRSNSAFGPAAAMAGVVAGSVAGWSPIGRRDDTSTGAHAHDEEQAQHARDQDGLSRDAANDSREPLNPHRPASSQSQATQLAEINPVPPPAPKLLSPPTRG